MRVNWGVIIVGAAALLLCGLLLTRLERYHEAVDQGFGPEARQNPFLAAQILAQRNGLQASSHLSLAPLENLNEFDVLFISRSSQIISAARLTALLDWLQAGGRLVVAASFEHPYHSDILLQHFGLTSSATHYDGRPIYTVDGEYIEYSDDQTEQYQQQIDKAELTRDLEELQGTAGNTDALSPTAKVLAYEAGVPAHEQVTVDWGDETLIARFNPAIELELRWDEPSDNAAAAAEHSPAWTLSGQQGMHMAEFEWGQGRVMVLSDAQLFTSTQIDKFDHARLWQNLMGAEARLGIVYGAQVPSLWAVMLRYLPEAMLAFALWLSVWIWRRACRFGPISRPQETVRRSRLEHIGARADYLWRGRWQRDLLESARTDVLRRARQVVPEFASLDQAEQALQLSRAAKLDTAQVSRALTGTDDSSEAAFVQTVQLLQKIRNAL